MGLRIGKKFKEKKKIFFFLLKTSFPIILSNQILQYKALCTLWARATLKYSEGERARENQRNPRIIFFRIFKFSCFRDNSFPAFLALTFSRFLSFPLPSAPCAMRVTVVKSYSISKRMPCASGRSFDQLTVHVCRRM
jgi:hypothetical protein